MKTLRFTIILLVLFCVTAIASAEYIPDTEYKVNKLADAIYWAEGGSNTNYPYGIKSVRCDNVKECRRICKNTIRNNIRRYNRGKRTGRHKSYLRFLQSRYCPLVGNLSQSEKALNVNWIGNVKKLLKNPKEIL